MVIGVTLRTGSNSCQWEAGARALTLRSAPQAGPHVSDSSKTHLCVTLLCGPLAVVDHALQAVVGIEKGTHKEKPWTDSTKTKI